MAENNKDITSISQALSYYSSQNFDLDIEALYSIITIIENFRSHVNITKKENEDKLKALESGDLVKLTANLKIESDPQESRCHAFFRYIGLPVINSNKTKFYNPGFDNIVSENRLITKDYKISIANDQLKEVSDISLLRESYLEKIRTLFSVNRSLNASVLALGSSTTTRSFIAPVEKIKDSLVIKAEDTKYTYQKQCVVGNNIIPLSEYVDSSGNTPTMKYYDNTSFNDQQHIIAPFCVNPKIDFTVNPVKNLICVPFAYNAFQRKISSIDEVSAPMLEGIIISRFTSAEDYAGVSNTETLNLIKTDESIKDENLVKSVYQADGKYDYQQQLIFNLFLNIIKSMMKKLVEAQRKIDEIQSKYYYLPIPSVYGPEYGSSFQPVFIKLDSKFRTDADKEIVDLKLQTILSEIQSQQKPAQKDTGGFGLSNPTSIGPKSTSGYGDKAEQSLKKIGNIRKNDMEEAAQALKIIEIIMGEFSGLGLCDIIAIFGALSILPTNTLCGFLDDDAVVRASDILNVEITRTSITESINTLTNTVKDMYSIMDKIYESIRFNNQSQ